MIPCACASPHERKRIVLTGGPGAGKTAVLEMIRHALCAHVRILPEAAGIIFGGGFPREDDDGCRRAAQRAIFHTQRELENTADNHNPAIVLCDRGTLDGLAYWPGAAAEFFSELDTTIEAQLARYAAVVHLRTPAADQGYNHANPLRVEPATVAQAIDAKIADTWRAHRRLFVIEPSIDFLAKAQQALAVLESELPECCRAHAVPAIDGPLLRGPAGRPA